MSEYHLELRGIIVRQLVGHHERNYIVELRHLRQLHMLETAWVTTEAATASIV